jgi:hypothetical protein
MSIQITYGNRIDPATLAPYASVNQASSTPSLTEMAGGTTEAASSTGRTPTNQTTIKPTQQSAQQQQNAMSNIGMPSLQQLSLGGSPNARSTASPLPNNTTDAGIAYTGMQPQDYANLSQFSDKQLRDILQYGANVVSPEQRTSIRQAAERELAARQPTLSAPTRNGMGATGRQDGVTATAPAPRPSVTEDYTPSPSPAPGTTVPGGQTPPAGNPNTPPPQNDLGTGTALDNVQPPSAAQPDDNPLTGSGGDGGTQFNPGGGTNPDGTNPTVPQGNANNGTAPSVYQLQPDSPNRYDGRYDDAVQDVITGNIAWNDLTPLERDGIIEALDARIANDPAFWDSWGADGGDMEAQNRIRFIKNEFIARRGDPSQGDRGAADNTRNEDGSVQGQFEGEQGSTFQAIASNAAENNRQLTEDEMASMRLNDITSQDSPLMRLAEQDGIDFANAAGLRNSSLAAGSMQREMVRQASPLAMQEAESYARQGLQNQQLESARRDANAARETQTSLTNAGMANDMMNSDRQREMSYNLQQLAGDQDYAKQELAANTAVDLANVEGQYNLLISDNSAAATMVQSAYGAIADVISNPEIYGDEASSKVNYLVQTLTDTLDGLLAFENLDLTLAGSTGAGENSNFVSSGGSTGSNIEAGSPEAQAAWDSLPENTRYYYTQIGITRDTYDPAFTPTLGAGNGVIV